jgi:hypothetical protein
MTCAALAALAMLGMGCGGKGFDSPLVGTWATPTSTGGLNGTVTVDLNGDGSLSVIFSGASTSCTGTETWTGYSWTSTSSVVAFSGTGSCAGGITCGPLTLNCSGNQAFQPGSCSYAFSNNNNTLILTNCVGTSNATYTRQN